MQKRPAAATLQKRPAAAATKKDNRSLTEAMRALGRWPKRKMQPKGDAEIAENNLAIRLSKALKKKKVGDDLELESILDALPEEPTIAWNSVAWRFRRLLKKTEEARSNTEKSPQTDEENARSAPRPSSTGPQLTEQSVESTLGADAVKTRSSSLNESFNLPSKATFFSSQCACPTV